ncbi:MAG: hypothetical protein GX970_07575 [Phyllobacteriaceae bacterium]|nr:hypothetical protein [Phyllobacteriaceae bacterium]
MTTAIGIFPAVMISWMAAETPLPQSHHLTEVARLRGELIEVQAKMSSEPNPSPLAKGPANGAEVDLLV